MKYKNVPEVEKDSCKGCDLLGVDCYPVVSHNLGLCPICTDVIVKKVPEDKNGKWIFIGLSICYFLTILVIYCVDSWR